MISSTSGGYFSEHSQNLSLSFFYKDRFNRSQKSEIVYTKASCWDCDAFYIGKTKRRLHDRKTAHFKALTQNGHASIVADHSISVSHNIKWNHFEILANGRGDLQCNKLGGKITECWLVNEEGIFS